MLDANVLIALMDPGHMHHDRAHGWFRLHRARGWATCPITENAVLRILGSSAYPNSPGSPAAVVPLLAELVTLDGHQFWPDDLSLLWRSAGLSADALSGPGRITDCYLAALAVRHGGRLATLDQHIPPRTIAGRDAVALIP